MGRGLPIRLPEPRAPLARAIRNETRPEAGSSRRKLKDGDDRQLVPIHLTHEAPARPPRRQNLLCAYLAIAVLVGLLANTLFGIWWLDPLVALGIAGVALYEGRKALRGETCVCGACSVETPPPRLG
jgi:hypothetical protein